MEKTSDKQLFNIQALLVHGRRSKVIRFLKLSRKSGVNNSFVLRLQQRARRNKI